MLSGEEMLSRCKVCNSDRVVTDTSTGEVICNNCGAVIEERILVAQKVRAFNKEEFEERSSSGAPSSLQRHDMGLSTVISRENKDASGSSTAPEVTEMMARLRTWDFRTRTGTPKDRNLVLAFNELEKLKYKLNIPDIVAEKAAYTYRKAQAMKLARGRTTISLVAAALYAACREFALQRNLKDIAEAANITIKSLSRSYRLLLYELDLTMPPQDPVLAIVKVASILGLSEKTKREAARILERVKQKGGTAGKDPMGLAGAILYLACIKNNEPIIQKKLAEAAGITEVTIRNRAKEIKSRHKDLFN